jgi:hypothetical protein
MKRVLVNIEVRRLLTKHRPHRPGVLIQAAQLQNRIDETHHIQGGAFGQGMDSEINELFADDSVRTDRNTAGAQSP